MADIKTINAVPVAGIKTYQSIPLADVKAINALALETAPAGPVEPDDIAGLGAWYRADIGAGAVFAAQLVAANNEYLTVPTNTSLRFGNIEWTVGGWFYQDITGLEVFAAKGISYTSADWQVHVEGGLIKINGYNGTGYPAATGAAAPPGQWHFVIGSFSPSGGGTFSIQLNDGAISSASGVGTLVDNSTGVVQFGGQPVSNTLLYNGRLQNWFMFGRALNATERSFLYNGGAGRSYGELDAAFKADLRAWWPLDEQSGSRRDLSGNNNTLTDNNTVGVTAGKVFNPSANGAPIYIWRDSGPNHLDLDAYIGAPTLIENGLNGLPVVLFPNTLGTRFRRAAPVLGSLLSGTNAGTIFAVLYQYAVAPNNALYGWLNPSPTNQIALYPTYAGYFDWDIGSAVPATGRIHVAAPAPWGDTWHLLELCRNGTAGEILYEGTVVATGTFSDDAETTGSVSFGVGWDDSGTFFNGYLGELIMYNRALSAGERDGVREYLTTKWFAPPQPDDIAGLQAWYKADEGVYSRSAAQLTVANVEYLSVPSNPSLQMGPTTDWTIAGWAWWDSVAGVQVLLCKCITSGSVDYQIYSNAGTLVVNAAAYPSGGTVTLPGAGQWVFVVARYHAASDGFNISVNNGVPVGNALAGPNPDSATGTFILGAQPDGASSFGGRMQNWGLFGRYLSDAEITFLYNSGNGRSYEELDTAFKTDLRAWWPLDEPSGSRRDLSGNGNTLTDNNTVTEADGKVLNPASDGVKIYQWSDQSVNARHLTQATRTLQPNYLLTQQNGLPAAEFIGPNLATEHYLDHAGAVTMGTCFLVYRNQNVGGTLFEGVVCDVADVPIVCLHTNPPLDWYLRPLTSAEMDHVFKDGVLSSSSELSWHSYGFFAGTPFAVTGVRVGKRGTVPGQALDGKIGEIIIYNTLLSDSDRVLIEEYLRAKWGLP